MNSYEYKEAVEKSLSAGNFHEAFRLLRVMLSADSWRLRDALDAAEEDYSRIIDFALSGAPDPGRGEQISALATRLYSILDMLLRESLVADHSSLYFNVVRTLRMRRGENLPRLLDDYSRSAAALGSFFGEKVNDAERRKTEELEEQIFDRIWTTTPLTFDEIAAIKNTMANDVIGDGAKSLIVGALTMSLLQFFSEPALRLLLDFAVPGSSVEIQARATVGAILVMARWPRRSNTPAIAARIAALRELGQWQQSVRHAIMQIIRTADVEAITAAMRDEIIPEMMKLRPDLERHIKESGFDPADMEANPEWEEMLNKSGLTDRLRKLSEMTEAGGDLFYPVFSMLKNYPFFNHISHWFLPFNASRLEVRRSLGHDAALELMLEESPVMCGSDKYSFALSVDRLPEVQKQMLMSQIGEAASHGNILSTSTMSNGEALTVAITGYIHDLYRFFRLFRRCGEFSNPFDRLINPVAIPELAGDFCEPDQVRLLGEFYFKHKHFAEAVDLFRTLQPDLELHQKMGHALQRMGRLGDALVEYERAEMLAPESEWTLKRLAQISKALGNHRKALDYYSRLEKIHPDSASVAMQMGHCHLELNELREALHYYYKAELLDEKSTKPLRPIAWSAFLNRDFETSERYFRRILTELTPTPSDYLNMGHLALAQGNVREALNYYSLNSTDPEAIAAAMREDLPLLERAGVDVSLIPLMLDSLRYRSRTF